MEVTWGTWEELLLGAAILRHGIRDWNSVSDELRTRAQCPYNFTPEVCRAKYEDLQRRYSECTTWFEEVRKKRMSELRQALEVSEDSIGSLETKLETLKVEKGSESRVNYASSHTESPMASQNAEGFESCGKESKDVQSAGSFTVEEKETETIDQTKISNAENLSENVTLGKQLGMLKKRRGARKRKDCGIGEIVDLVNTTATTTTSRSKENTITDCAEVSKSSVLDEQARVCEEEEDEMDDLLNVFNSIVEHKCASNFRHRLDSQKRGRYKKMIRKHVDFNTLRSKITSRSIVSVKELFRDLLLLANNALVFYSKNTREYKSARLLRDHITKALHSHFNTCKSNKDTSQDNISPTMKTISGNSDKPGKKNPTIDNDVKALKKDIVLLKRGGRKSNIRRETENPVKGRKRVRAS